MKRQDGFYWVKDRSADTECGWEWVVAEWCDGWWRPIFDEYERTDECWIEIDERRIVRDEPFDTTVTEEALQNAIERYRNMALSIGFNAVPASELGNPPNIKTLQDAIDMHTFLINNKANHNRLVRPITIPPFAGYETFTDRLNAERADKMTEYIDPHPEHQMD